ncbi:hypothetical protein ACSVBT_16535 [Afipia sp. TerB]
MSGDVGHGNLRRMSGCAEGSIGDGPDKVKGDSRAYLNCARHCRLSFLMFLSMQAAMRFTFGTSSRQNFIASLRQARRCSYVPAAWLTAVVARSAQRARGRAARRMAGIVIRHQV